MKSAMLSQYKNKTINDIFLNISHFFDHFIMLIFAKAAYESGKSFGLNYDQFILYGVFGFIFFGAMSPLAAQIADKFSRSLVMVFFHFGFGIAAILAGLAQSPTQVGIAISLMGIFASIYHPVGIAMLIKNNKNIGFRLGINGVFGNIGVAGAPIITGILLTFGDWRLSFILPGCICLIYGFVFSQNLKEEISVKNEKNQNKNHQFAPNWFRALLALGLTTISGGFIFGSMTFFVPRYFEISMQNISTSIFITGLLASTVYTIASFTQIVVGWLVDRYSPRAILLIMGIGQTIFIVLASNLSDFSLLVTMTFAMAFVFGQVPITDTILARYVPDRWRTKTLSIKFLLNLTIGASVLPTSSLILQAGYSMNTLFVLIGIIAIFVVISAILLPKQAEHQRLDI